MEHVIVERVFAEPVSIEQVETMLRQGKGCLSARRIRHLRTYMSPDGRRMICEYEAPDAETVREVSRQLGMPFERAWTARVVISGEDPAPESV